jgi:hypothetical protein
MKARATMGRNTRDILRGIVEFDEKRERGKAEEKAEGDADALMILPLLAMVDKRGSAIA